ncbi:MAG: chorismate synthase [Deltaproteobacteria bacterium]|nr:MAG: chorismate synthase [Deltaproteobacteria bacterium]
MALRYFTAGESHGPGLTAIVEGFPAGVPIDVEAINRDLARRMGGYGRGGRMKIERDQAELRSGVRWGESLGSPITLWIENRDWVNWEKKMSPRAEDRDPALAVTRPRPGHADLAGALKYNHRDVRNVLERASARETAARVAVGGLAKCLLEPFGIRVHGWVAEIGGISANQGALAVEQIAERAEASAVRMADPEAERRIIDRIDECKRSGDTLGGVVETVVTGLPPGLGSHAQWDRKLDGRLAHALMSVQAAKGVEIGLGFETARRPGSKVHDEIYFDEVANRFLRRTNNAGGTEGGMSSGEPLVVRTAFKPLSTLMSPLHSVDIDTKDEAKAAIERSDVVAVPAAAVIAEAVVAFVVTDAFLEKFGGDSLAEIRRNLDGYLEQVRRF